MGIRAKIVLPFTLLFAVAILAAALLAAQATGRAVEERIQGQMSELAAVLSQAGFAGNPNVLRKIKAIVGGELATVDAEGAVLATTLEADAALVLTSQLKADPPAMDSPPPRRLRLNGEGYRVTFAPVEASHWRQGETYVYLLTPEAEVRAAARRAAQPIVVAAACGAVAVAVLGYFVGHALSRPVESLAAQARSLAAGHSQAPLAVRTHDEVGALAVAFNALLQSLRAAEEKVVAAERLAAVGQVAAGIAHEVRNPLSAIKMSAQLLRQRLRELDPDAAESAEVMLAEVARLEVIIDDLLTFARPTEPRLEAGDVNAVIGEVLDFMARQLEHAGVAVGRDLADDLPPVPLDPQRVRQVVLNLVLNAAEAMPNGGTLTARTRAGGGAVVAEIEDTGGGIAPEVAGRIFEPFFTTKRGGSGLGLGVSRTIIEAHGGTIRFEPLEHGTRFIFTIPRRQTG